MAVTSADAPAPRKVRVWRFTPLLVGAIALAGYLGYRAWSARRPYEWSGTIEARTMSVGSRTGGRVKQVVLKEGDRAAVGQPLLVLETGDLDAQELMARAQLDQAQASLDKLKAGARPEEIDQAKARAQTAEAALVEAQHGSRVEEVAGAKARLAAAQVTVDKAQLDDDRARRLLESGSVSMAEVDSADAALRGALAQRNALSDALDELVNGVRREEIAQAATRAAEARASSKLVQAGSRVEDLRAGQAAVDGAKGKLDQILVMMDELTVFALRQRAKRGDARLASGRHPRPQRHGRRPPRGRPALRADLRARDAGGLRQGRGRGPCLRRLLPRQELQGTDRARRHAGRVLAAQPADGRRAGQPGVRDTGGAARRRGDPARGGWPRSIRIPR